MGSEVKNIASGDVSGNSRRDSSHTICKFNLVRINEYFYTKVRFVVMIVDTFNSNLADLSSLSVNIFGDYSNVFRVNSLIRMSKC